MKMYIKVVTRNISILALFLSSMLWSQAKNEENSILWKITGKGLQSPSYFLITYPNVCNKDFVLNKQVIKAINSVKQYVMPVNLGDKNQLLELMMTKTKVPVTDHLSNEEVVVLKQNLNKIKENYTTAKDQSARLLFEVAGLQFFNNCPAYDFRELPLEYMQQAINRKKEMVGLENAKEQNEILDSVYNSKKLIAVLLNFEQVKSQYRKAAKAYSAGNMNEAYDSLTSDEILNDSEKKILIEDVNNKWVDKILMILKSNTSIFALPVENAYGNQGIIDLIKSQGYTIEPSH